MKVKFGLALLFVLLLLAIAGPSFSHYTYYDVDLQAINQPPNEAHWFGTDDLGRDLFTRICFGARISLFVGFSAALIDLFIGVVWGSAAAFAGGIVDRLMMAVADILYSLPYLLVVILILMFLGPGLLSIIIAMAAMGWITMARIVRGQVLQIKTQEYVLAATVLGAGFGRILFTHLIPNARGAIVTTLMLTIPSAIFTEAFLSFLGLGVQAPVASWGTMANEGLSALAYYPWRLFFPAGMITTTLFSFYLLSDGMKDVSAS